MLDKTNLVLYKTDVGTIVIAEDTPNGYHFPCYIKLQTNQKTGEMGVNFFPISAPILDDLDVTVPKSTIDGKISFDYTPFKAREEINELLEAYISFVSQTTSGIIPPPTLSGKIVIN